MVSTFRIAIIFFDYQAKSDWLHFQFKSSHFHKFDSYFDDFTKKFIQEIQQNYECCGLNSFVDFESFPEKVPNSCCGKYADVPTAVGACSLDALKKTNGCKSLFVDEWMKMEDPYYLYLLSNIVLIGLPSICIIPSVFLLRKQFN